MSGHLCTALAHHLLLDSLGTDVCCIHVQHSAEPKVRQLAHKAPCILCTSLEQHIGCLEVTMHHTHGMQVVQTRCNIQQSLVDANLQRSKEVVNSEGTMERYLLQNTGSPASPAFSRSSMDNPACKVELPRLKKAEPPLCRLKSYIGHC